MHSPAVSLKSLQTQFKQLNKLLSLSDTSLSSLDAFVSSRTLSGLNWYSSTAAMFVSRQSWAQWRHTIWRRRYCPIFEQGFHMVRKCFGGWNFGECSIFVLTFCRWKEKKSAFLDPTKRFTSQNKTEHKKERSFCNHKFKTQGSKLNT